MKLASLSGWLTAGTGEPAFCKIREDCTDLLYNEYTLLLSVCQGCVDFTFRLCYFVVYHRGKELEDIQWRQKSQ
jgi:hypothetical protein